MHLIGCWCTQIILIVTSICKGFELKLIVCVCLDFLKPKTRINEKVGNKMRLAEPKTQLLGSGKIHVQNALHLWTSEVHKWKRVAGRFWLLPLDVAFTKMPLIYLTQTHKLISSLTPSSLIYVFFLRLLPLRLPLLLHRSTPTINKTHFNLWYSEHRINKTKPKITQNQHKNNLKSTQIQKTHPKPNSKSTQNP